MQLTLLRHHFLSNLFFVGIHFVFGGMYNRDIYTKSGHEIRRKVYIRGRIILKRILKH
jgi:hypothetical protein